MPASLNPRKQEPSNATFAPTNSFVNRITISYVSTLTLIALLSLFSYAALNDVTVNQQRIAVLVNTAGRQRMLSQKIALLSLQFAQSPPGGEVEDLRAQLLDQADEMGTAHTRLVDDNPATNLSGQAFSPEIRAMYFDPPFALDTQVADYLSSVQALARVDDPMPDDIHLSYIVNNAPGLLNLLDAVVNQYTAESVAATVNLERRELLTFISILGLLLIVGWFIFRPLEHQIRREHLKLTNEIEERKQAEKNLRDSEGFVQRILEMMPDPVYLYDAVGQAVGQGDIYISREFLQTLGYPPNQLQISDASSLIKLMHPDDVQAMRQRGTEYFKNGATGILENEYRLKNAKGEWRWFYSRDILFSRNPDNTPWQMIGTARDITDRKQVEIAHSQMAALIQSSNDAIIGKTLEGVITSWNSGAERLYGYTAEESIGKSVSLLIPPGEFDELPYILKTLQQGDPIENYETIHVDKNNRHIHVSLTISPIQDSSNNIIGASAISRDITEQKQAQAAVQRSQMLYRTLIQNLPDMAVILYDRDMRYLLAEGTFLEKTGYHKAEMEGKLLNEVLPSPSREVIESYLLRAFSGEVSEFERQAGDLTYIGRIIPITDSSEGIINALFVIQDVTQSKLADKELRESEERFRTLVTYSPVGIIQTDAQGECIFVNQRWSEITGFSEIEALGSGWVMALHPEDRDMVFAVWLTTAYAEREFNVEYRFQKADGETIWVLGSIVALRNEDDDLTGYFGTIIDITDRKTIELELSEREQRFRQLAENIDYAFWMIKPDFAEVLYISPAYEVIWGRTCESMYENPLSFLEAVHPEDREQVQNERTAKMMSGHYNVEYRVIRPDGEVRWVHSRAFPVIDEDGQIYRIAGISEDITDRKKAGQQAMELHVEREKVHMLSEFITNTSHELRTPLSTISTSVYLAQRQTEPEKQKRYFEMIETRVWQLNRLIDQLHMMAKLDSSTDLGTASIQVNQIIESITFNLNDQAATKHILITHDLQAQLPVIQAHYEYIHHAIENLLENAVLYTSENGTIIIRTFASAENVVVEIEDNGVGIKPENIDRIFDRFYKINEARTGNSSGAGLGLTMVKKIAELHHGTIEVESVSGEGSVFRLHLPIHQPEQPPLPYL